MMPATLCAYRATAVLARVQALLIMQGLRTYAGKYILQQDDTLRATQAAMVLIIGH